jgi:hypothetical protein
MSWRDKIKKLVKEEWDSLTGEPSQPQGGSQQPPTSSQYQVLWQPQFHPQAPVHVEWDPKLGNGPDGWGNQELQHYTGNPENCF